MPLAAGGAGIVEGPTLLKGVHAPVPTDVGSHFRYLSGLLLGLGIGFAACIPNIERRGPLVRTLGLIVIVGGLARLFALLRDGPPSAAHLGALAIELGATPVLLLWQARVARLCGASRQDSRKTEGSPDVSGDPSYMVSGRMLQPGRP